MADEPWWRADPTIRAATQAALEELAQQRPGEDRPAGPDLVVTELCTGAAKYELAAARDARNHAAERYVDAIRAARAAGFSWGEIGELLGESRQSLHRRFGAVE